MPDPSVSARLFGDEEDEEEDDDESSSSPRPAGSVADADARHHDKPSGDFLAEALALFDDPSPRGVHDWNTSDSMAFKVIGPYVAAHPRRRATARFVLAWAAAGSRARRGSPPVNPYRRRAGVVAFLNYVADRSDATSDATSEHASLPPPSAVATSAHRMGGDGLFGDGFVAELAKACGDVLAAVDSETRAIRRIPPRDSSDWENARREPPDGERGAEGAAEGAEGADASDDEVPVDDPTLSPMAAEAWAADGAWAVLGLCARESARVDRARIAAERGGGNRRFASVSGGEETRGVGASKRARTEA